MRKIIGIMIVFLMIGCGQQRDVASGGRNLSEVLLEVGRSTEKAFYTFLELVSDTLGFRVTKGTTKQQVGEHFTALGKKLGEASAELEKVAEKAIADIDKSDESKNPVRIAVDTAKATLIKLKEYLDNLGTVGGTNVVGWAATNGAGAEAGTEELKKAYNALKGIVDTAKKQQVKEPSASNVTLQQASIGITSPQDGAKILATGGGAPTAGDAGKAAAIVAAVSGEEILYSIVKSTESDADTELGVNAEAGTSALKFAKGTSTNSRLAQGSGKAAAVAGGIALRSLVKDGKLGANNGQNDDKAAQAAGLTAVNKLVGAVEEIIKKTVKNVLDKAKIEIDKARAQKAEEQK